MEKPIELENLGSLITIKGTNQCLGDLIYFEGHGTFDATLGLVPVSKDDADKHNRCLDAAKLEGMDKNCEVGQGSYAYFLNNQIKTFLGTVISGDFTRKGNSVTFKRAGKVYRGRLSKGDTECFNFKRIS